jgi:nucleoside-diphosphate-sugar epimerase
MMSRNHANEPRITAMEPRKISDVLHRAGARHVSPETIQADIEAGAPVNDDGTVNLIEYAAWLVQRMADGD